MRFTHPELEKFLSTRSNHVDPLHRFFQAAGITTWQQVLVLDRPTAARARDAMMENFKPASVQHSVSALRTLFRYLCDRGVLKTNPISDLKVQGGGSTVPLHNYLPNGAIEKLLAAPKGKDAARDRAVLTALVDHGFRASELCGLKWSDVVEDAGRLVVTFTGKKGKLARVRLSERVAKLLGPKQKANYPLIPRGKDNAHLDRFEVYAIVKQWCSAIGFPRVTPHGLRATYITGVYLKTHDIEKARLRGRHENIGTTQRYLRYVDLGDDE